MGRSSLCIQFTLQKELQKRGIGRKLALFRSQKRLLNFRKIPFLPLQLLYHLHYHKWKPGRGKGGVKTPTIKPRSNQDVAHRRLPGLTWRYCPPHLQSLYNMQFQPKTDFKIYLKFWTRTAAWRTRSTPTTSTTMWQVPTVNLSVHFQIASVRISLITAGTGKVSVNANFRVNANA